jgi:hypothetical protein
MQMEAISGSSFYATLLSWAFLATNSIRILAYLPTIKKLLRAEATADCQSQLTHCTCSKPIIAKSMK